MHCPLCTSKQTVLFESDKKREYRQCSHCSLIFVPTHQLPTHDAERKRYDEHNNNYEDKQYRRYLSTKIEDIKQLGIDLSMGPILDFGAGKEAVMTKLLNEEGHDATAYDPLYAMDDLSKAPFSLIIMNEVIEHLHDPATILDQLVSLLAPQGFLYINTELTDTTNDFKRWWYRSDPTHVHFYAEQTMHYLAHKFSLHLRSNNHKNRALFQKK